MKDITNRIGVFYKPMSAMLVYQSQGRNKDTYIEYYDIDKDGKPINAHPLTVREAAALARALNIKKEKQAGFLKLDGILPENVLYLDPHEKGSVLWYTKAKKVKLLFTEKLEIPCGLAHVPALLWYADRHNLHIFALSSDKRPTEKTALYYAPFFNVYENATVCMGTVNVQISKTASLNEFTQAWESYFFNSYFSHLMEDFNPVEGNCVSLWKSLVGTSDKFPKEKLKRTGRAIKKII